MQHCRAGTAATPVLPGTQRPASVPESDLHRHLSLRSQEPFPPLAPRPCMLTWGSSPVRQSGSSCEACRESMDKAHLSLSHMPGHRDLKPWPREPDEVPWMTGPAAATGTWHTQTRCWDLTRPDTQICCRNQACLNRCSGRQD